MKITIGLADDQQLFLKSLGGLINSFPSYEVILDALNGKDLMLKLSQAAAVPEILLIDVDMPVMDGVETVKLVSQQFPLIRTAALSMTDDDATIIQMLKAGCCAYLLKDIHPLELERALGQIHADGYYNADAYNTNIRRLLNYKEHIESVKFTDNEITFLRLAASDLTYKQIAVQMRRSERTIDGYRETLFEKLGVQSRVGLVLEGIRRKIVPMI